MVSLFDLGQLLLLNGATGCLVVHSNERRGFLYFVEGRLVNAVDDAYQQGENVACQIFSWKSGAFQFRPEAPSGAATITNGTEAVMLEAARRMDEAGLAGEGSRESVRLTERQTQLNALRDVFKQVTSDASAVTAAAAAAAVPAPSVHLYALEQPGDRLVYRSGHPPRLRHKGVWSEAGEPPMSAAAFGTLRAWLLEACKAPDGSYWALQSWVRLKPNYGGTTGATELHLSHWRGPLAILTIYQNWAERQYRHLFGRLTYKGRGAYGFNATGHGAPLDSYGRNIYVDTFDSRYGKGWHRENSFLTHHRGKTLGDFCYGFFSHGSHPPGKGTKYRATAEGPGVTPDVMWAADDVGTYDASAQATQQALERSWGDPKCLT